MLIRSNIGVNTALFQLIIYGSICIIIGNSQKVCPTSFQWDCDNGQCIDATDLCDGKVNCDDGSDEIAENCIQVQCPEFAFRCTYGACVAGTEKCNGVQDCADNSDEMPLLCNQNITEFELQLTGKCWNQMQCRSGECIDNENKCDGRLDCEDGSDEIVEVCSTLFCPSYAFQCGYGGCVSGTAKCNGRRDCPDGSDEAYMLCNYTRFSNGKTAQTDKSTTTTRKPFVEKPIIENGCELELDSQHMYIQSVNLQISLRPGAVVAQNDIVSFSCEQTYILEGELRNFCTQNGWRYEMPRCFKYCNGSSLLNDFSTEAVCYHLGRQIKCNSKVPPGAEAQITCAKGFITPSVTSGQFFKKLECTNDGFWNHLKSPCFMECGLVAPKTTEFAQGGVEVNITEVPWHVGIYGIFNSHTFDYTCGGTIISPTLVISAAHCFWDKANDKLYKTSLFSVVAGKYFKDYYKTDEFFQVQKRNVSEIIVENYDNVRNNFANDIAILVLVGHFKFTHSIRPVCIEFQELARVQVESGVSGTFTGWGFDQTTSENPLVSVSAETVSHNDCEKLLHNVIDYELYGDKFCINNVYGTGAACRGDSGGGFVISRYDPRIRKSFYSLMGVISHAPIKVQDCSKDGVAVLTNVQFFQNVITKYIDREFRVRA